jgi:hypothetical protein
LAATLVKLSGNLTITFEVTFFLCAIPTFLIGLAEDVTKRVGVKPRLLLTLLSAFFATQLLGAIITGLDIPGIDSALQIHIVAVIFSIFAITSPD